MVSVLLSGVTVGTVVSVHPFGPMGGNGPVSFHGVMGIGPTRSPPTHPSSLKVGVVHHY